MNGDKVRAVVDKEFAEARKNKMIVISMALIPIFLLAMALGTAVLMMREGAMGDEEVGLIPTELGDMEPLHAFMLLMNDQYLFYFLIIPMMLPVYIAAYSIVGEKETKSLEPLLATPVSVGELLVGKSFAAVVPAVVLTWLSFLALIVSGYFIMPGPVFQGLIRPVWLVGMILLSPLLAVLSVLCGVIVSSRLNDPRAAQQVTGVFVIPIVGLSLIVLMGKVYLDVPLILIAAAVTLALDGLALFFAVRLFQRETILTRWK